MNSPFVHTRPDLVTITPGTVETAADAIRSAADDKCAILVRGGGTKWSMGQQPTSQAIVLATTGLTGILEYEPGELTFTARAGTPLAEIQVILAAKGQYLPFDPPFADFGATLGGTVAAGLSGPRRLRYGGLRDFILGIEYLDAAGVITKGGGKVVKNAAGYDFPKLFCGSMGTLGILTQVSFKVFPVAQGHQTLVAGLANAQSVQAVLRAIQHSRIEVSAADSWPAGTIATMPDLPEAYTLAIQIEGTLQSLEPRLKSLQGLLPVGTATHILNGPDEAALWNGLRDLAWVGDEAVILRIYLSANQLAELDTPLADLGVRRVFSLAGNVCWAAFAGSVDQVTPVLQKLGVRASVWRSPVPTPDVIPTLSGAAMVKRVKQAFDPHNLFRKN